MIERTIVGTIGCSIMNAIFPPHRHGETRRGDSETEDEQGKRRGEREGDTGLRYRYTVSVKMF